MSHKFISVKNPSVKNYPTHEVYACGSDRHYWCLISFLVREKLSPVIFMVVAPINVPQLLEIY